MAAAVNINKNGKPTIMAGGKYDAYLYPSPLSACFKLIFPKCQPPQILTLFPLSSTLAPFFSFLFSKTILEISSSLLALRPSSTNNIRDENDISLRTNRVE